MLFYNSKKDAKMKKILVALMVCSILSGCASIIKGRSKAINLMTSTGEEAEVDIVSASGMQTLVVPTITTIKRANQDITITVRETPSNKTSTSVIASRIEPWFLGNIITGGILGSATDALTGAMWTYDDNIVIPVYNKEEKKAEAPKKKRNPKCENIDFFIVKQVQNDFVLAQYDSYGHLAFLSKEMGEVYFDDKKIIVPVGKCAAFIDSKIYTIQDDIWNETSKTQDSQNEISSEKSIVRGERTKTAPVVKFIDAYL